MARKERERKQERRQMVAERMQNEEAKAQERREREQERRQIAQERKERNEQQVRPQAVPRERAPLRPPRGTWERS